MNLSIVLIYITIMIFITIIQVILVRIYPELLTNEALFTTFSSIVNLVLYSLLFLIFIILFRKYFVEQLLDLKTRIAQILFILVVGFLAMIAVSVLSSIILQSIGVTETSENQEALNMLIEGSMFDKISLFIFAVILAPVVEEFVFRKAILNMFHFEQGYDDGGIGFKFRNLILASFAVIISSLAFGFVHVSSGDFVQIIYYAFLGIVLGTLYLVSKKNIYVPIFVHFLINLMVTSLMLFE